MHEKCYYECILSRRKSDISGRVAQLGQENNLRQWLEDFSLIWWFSFISVQREQPISSECLRFGLGEFCFCPLVARKLARHVGEQLIQQSCHRRLK